MTKDEMEEEGILEVCKNCNSIHLIEHSDNQIECRDCGAVNYTKFVKEEEYEGHKSYH